MQHGSPKRQELFKQHPSPELRQRDHTTLTAPGPSFRHGHGGVHARLDVEKEHKKPCRERCCNFIYNKKDKTFCGRTGKCWLYIIAYTIVYLCFLLAYTSIVLFASLWIVRATTDYKSFKIDSLRYSEHGVGLTISPVSESLQSVLWYRKDNKEDYEKYTNVLDGLVKKSNRSYVESLGPCGVAPYGYASNMPCVIVRINKHLNWVQNPLDLNSSLAERVPIEVQSWMKTSRKLWLHCGGLNSYDKEHIGRIRYYPDPPGFDHSVFPLGEKGESPLVAVQISNFTLGVSLSVECKLWYAKGPSAVNFIMYVASDDKTVSNRSSV